MSDYYYNFWFSTGKETIDYFASGCLIGAIITFFLWLIICGLYYLFTDKRKETIDVITKIISSLRYPIFSCSFFIFVIISCVLINNYPIILYFVIFFNMLVLFASGLLLMDTIDKRDKNNDKNNIDNFFQKEEKR